MNYYKIIKDDTIIGVATQQDFRVYQHKHNIVLTGNADNVQYICHNHQDFYRASWMAQPTTDIVHYQMAQVIPINKEEYDLLLKAIESNEEIVIEQPNNENPSEEVFTDPIEEATIDFVRTSKVAEMNSVCNKTITKGFDITLSDGNVYHFSLTTQDQLNLITLASMVEGGETQIPYHADGEPCKFYSAEDIRIIITTATQFKTYHVSYFNSLKIYINNIETKEEISAITYGVEIPEEYQSEVLKTMFVTNGGE